MKRNHRVRVDIVRIFHRNVMSSMIAEISNIKQNNSDRLQGVIQNPFAFYFPIQRGFSGSVQTLPFAYPSIRRGPFVLSTYQFCFFLLFSAHFLSKLIFFFRLLISLLLTIKKKKPMKAETQARGRTK